MRTFLSIFLSFFLASSLAANAAEAVAPTPTTSKPTCALDQHPALVLKCLIENHPDEETKSRIIPLIDSQKVYLDFDERNIPPGAIAAFGIHEIPEQGRIWVLHVRPSLLISPKVAQSYKQLVIEHEAEHIFQILDEDVPLETFLEPANRDQKSLIAAITVENVRNKFTAELGAYQKECNTAIKMDWENEVVVAVGIEKISLCVEYKREGIISLRKNVAKMLISSLPDFPELREQKALVEKLGKEEK